MDFFQKPENRAFQGFCPFKKTFAICHAFQVGGSPISTRFEDKNYPTVLHCFKVTLGAQIKFFYNAQVINFTILLTESQKNF